MEPFVLTPKFASRLLLRYRFFEAHEKATLAGFSSETFENYLKAVGQDLWRTEDISEIVKRLEVIAEGKENEAIVPGNIQDLVRAYEDWEREQEEAQRNPDSNQIARMETAGALLTTKTEAIRIAQIQKAGAEPQPVGVTQPGKPVAVDLGWLAKRDRTKSFKEAVAEIAGERAEEVAGTLEAELSPIAAGGAHINPGGLSALVKQVLSRTLGEEALIRIGEGGINSAVGRVGETPTGQNILGEGPLGLEAITTGRHALPPSQEEEEPAPQDQKDTRTAREARLLLLVSYHRPFFLREVANTIVGLPILRPWQILYAIGRENYIKAHPEAAVVVDLSWTHGITAESISRAITALQASRPGLPADSPVLRGATLLFQSLREYETERPRISFFLKALRPQPDVELVEEAERVPVEGIPLPTTRQPAKVIRVVSRHEGERVLLLRTEPVQQKEGEEKEPGTSFFNTLRNIFRKGGKKSDLLRLARKDLNRWIRRRVGSLFKQTFGRLANSLKNFFSSLAKRLFGKLSSSIFNFFAGKKVVVRQVITGAQRGLFGFIKSLFRSIGSFADRSLSGVGRLLGRGLQAAGRLLASGMRLLIQAALNVAKLLANAVFSGIRAIAGAVAAAGIPGVVIVLIIAAVGGLMFLGYHLSTSMLAPFAEEPTVGPAPGIIESRYIGIDIEASPESFENNTAKGKEASYKITVSAREGKLTNVSVKQDFTLYGPTSGEARLTEQPLIGEFPSTIEAQETATFIRVLEENFNNSIFVNTVTVTADVEGGPTGEQASRTAVVIIGEPVFWCFLFDDGGEKPWGPERARVIRAIVVLARARAYVDQLCTGTGPVQLQRRSSFATEEGDPVGGFYPGGNIIYLYDFGIANDEDALYTLAHESGHVYAARFNQKFVDFRAQVNPPTGESYLESYGFTTNCRTCEDFAETVALYVVWPTKFFKSVKINMKEKYPNHYAFAKTELFDGGEY